ncbi:unsaturated glucuronyl hydrolase-like [Oppia nitens]|uniref:unsaturated glucuronyl hydrolase-like n=1 Tax=Oppia nitens TaxID=1686743 RepID=UPI0023D9D3AB|nr:unsaturated glucuronyl hydrolase-like [Oppia nitens]
MKLKFTNICLIILLVPIVNGITRKELVDYAVRQYNRVTQTVKTGVQYPSIGNPWSAQWEVTPPVDNQWTAGFYPGILWHLYNYTKDDHWKQLATKATDAMYNDQYNTWQHDIGFMIMCSYGNAYEFTKNPDYPKIIVNAANHLAKRFNPKIGCTRSWDSGHDGQFLVIVDNVMNLELLFEGWKHSGNETLYDMAVSHINVTLKEHLRSDYSHYHVVSFNESNGRVIRKFTAMGYADWSCWSQGQAWLVAGLTIAYRYTKADYILKAAQGVSNYFIDHLADDGIAHWDFSVPHDPQHRYIPRDTAAASIAANGLIELYSYTKNEKYLNAFNKIMNSLNTSKYKADGNRDYKIPALLVNGSTDAHLHDSALIFGDYYYVKAFRYVL